VSTNKGPQMLDPNRESKLLRVLIADESAERLALLAGIVRGVGHETIAAEIDVASVGPATARERPDVALVAVGDSNRHALDLISKIVAEAECPVIAVLSATDTAFVREAAKRGIFAYVVDSDPGALESALEIVLLRFREYHGLEGAFGRRALIERAKGVLMERHGIDELDAFEALRSHARRNNQKIVDVAAAVIGGHLLLPPRS
jgi:response regulator NasT